MLLYFAKFSLFICVFGDLIANADLTGEESKSAKDATATSQMKEAIEEFELGAKSIRLLEEKRTRADKDLYKLIDSLVSSLERIMILLQEPNNVHTFIEVKGIDRVISSHLLDYTAEFRSQLLNMIRYLFEVAPTTVKAVMLGEVLEKLLDLFEEEDTLKLKGKVMEILHLWLPGNPVAQAQVMKRGLEPFYEQIHKLDSVTVESSMKLFSKILKEHLKVREENIKERKIDASYERIGLIKKVSTPQICSGLMNIFRSYAKVTKKYYMVSLLHILIDVEPYCWNHFVKLTNAAQFFKDLEKHVNELGDTDKQHYEALGLNVDRLRYAVKKYVEEVMKSSREEF